jgi:hypothetical protein
MQMKTSQFTGTPIAAVLLGLSCAGAAVAQDDVPRPRVQTGSCAEVAWAPDLLSQYPRLAEGCHEVVILEDEKWARFEAGLVQAHNDGSVTLDFKDRFGRSIEELTLMFGPNQRADIDGRSRRFTELERGQVLNVYVPEGIFAVATEPGAAPQELAPVVVAPERLSTAPPDRTLAAQADTAAARELPRTAGPLPILALAGAISLLGGLGLTIARLANVTARRTESRSARVQR